MRASDLRGAARSLDPRILRDLGFHRSELLSVAAEDCRRWPIPLAFRLVTPAQMDRIGKALAPIVAHVGH